MYCYKFESKEQFLDLCKTEGFTNEVVIDEEGTVEDVLACYTHEYSIDVIGPITIGGEWDFETGEELVAPTVHPEHHVNFLGTKPVSWEPFLVEVDNPVRCWAGVSTQPPVEIELLEEEI